MCHTLLQLPYRKATTENYHANIEIPQQNHFLEAPRTEWNIHHHTFYFSLKGYTGTAETTTSQMLTKFIDFFTFGLQIIDEVLQPTLLGQPLAIADIFYINIQTTCQEQMQSALLIHRILA